MAATSSSFSVNQGYVETSSSFSVNQGYVETKKDLKFLSGQMKYFAAQMSQFLEKNGGLASEKFEQFMELMTDPDRFESAATSTRNAASFITTEQRELLMQPFSTLGASVMEVVNELCDKFSAEVLGMRATLSEATYQGKLSLMREVMNDSNINETQDDSKFTPLHLAARAGHSGAVRLLLEHPQVQINARDSWNGTPFHNACAEGYTDIARNMLACEEHKVDLNALNNFAQTPLDLAVKNGKHEVADVLLQLGARDGETIIAKLREAHTARTSAAKATKKADKQPIVREELATGESDTWFGNAWQTAGKLVEANF